MTAFELHSTNIGCPYCGEQINVDIDCSVEQQTYIEDCQVCCSPIVFCVSVDLDGVVAVSVSSENE